MKFLNIFFLFFISSCGDNLVGKSQIENKNIYVSYEKNEFICESCLLLNIESRLVQIIFDQKTDFHNCSGSFSYRNIEQINMMIPVNIGETNEYQIEYISQGVLSDCLTDILDFSIKRITNQIIEVYINNENYRLKK